MTAHGPSQRYRIIAALIEGRGLTATEARQMFGADRLAARICELRRAGWNIVTEMIVDATGDLVALYRLGTPARLPGARRWDGAA